MSAKVFFTQGWSQERNLGKYFNEFMAMLPDGSYGCLMDYDSMFLTKDYGKHIYEYIKRFPGATFICYANRIGCDYQRLPGVHQANHDINFHRDLAEKQKEKLYQVTDFSKSDPSKLFGGFLMLLSKENWKAIGGFREHKILDIDNYLHLDLMKHGKQILRMDGIYMYHWYRADGKGKEHLL